jgi:Endonuclease-reverse transcriptase
MGKLHRNILTCHKIQRSCWCFQESGYVKTFHSYSVYQSSQTRADGHPCDRVALLIRNNIPHTLLTITSPLEVAAVRVTSLRSITVCSIYLSPHSNWNETDLLSITQQLPPPIVFQGGLNAHNTMWSCTNTDAKGKYVENFRLLNNKQPTYLHPATGSYSSTDLSLCDPNLYFQFSLSVFNDQCASDHFPIVLGPINKPCETTPQWWKLKRAD